jgi:3',5'-cyclic AMP phosphodiesterase CpdA
LARRNQSLRIDLLNDLKEMTEKLGPSEAVLVTGDIAFSGLPAEYAAARQWLNEVTKTVGASPTSVLCVPGNHDVHRNAIGLTGETIRDRLRQSGDDGVDEVLDRFLAEPQLPILTPLANYNDFATRYVCHIGSTPYWEADLPLDDGWTLTVRGITTVLCSDHRDRRANLVIGRTQATLPLDKPKRIYMILAHHSPDWWQDQDRVLDALRHRARVLLCGHKHNQRIEQVDDMLRIVAGAVHPEEGKGWEPRYNCLTFEVLGNDTAALRLRIYPRVFREARNRFVEDRVDGNEYQEHRLVIGEETRSRGSAAGQPIPDNRHEDEEESVPAAALRPPLLQPSGAPEPERDMVATFLELTYPEQMGVLQGLGLLEEDDRDKGFVRIAVAALERARERKFEGRLKEEVDRVIRSRRPQ